MRLFDDVIDTRKIDSKLMARISSEKVKTKKLAKVQERLSMIDTIRKNSRLAPGRRLFDILFALLAITITMPVMALMALAIKIESRGPVFYVSKRAGRGYRIFNFYKFRTMQCDADKKVDQLKQTIAGVGESCKSIFQKVVRRSTYDPNRKVSPLNQPRRTTPVLQCALFGDMSLVGNRPLPLYEASLLTTDEWSKRFMAPAGITGLWQIHWGSTRHFMTDEERIKLILSMPRNKISGISRLF